MEDRFNICSGITFKWEGIYSNDPRDTGGATKFGITLDTLSKWRGKKVTASEVKKLDFEEAKTIYKTNYWNVVNADNLPKGLDLIVFDAAINHGTDFATKALQKVAGIATQDGIIGPGTLRAISLQPTQDLIEFFAVLRKERYVTRPNFETFGRGWFNRLEDVVSYALEGYTEVKWTPGNYLDFIVPDVDDFISNLTLQKLLKEVDYYKGEVDGLFGPKSIQAMANFLEKEFGVAQVRWPLERRKILAAQIFAQKAKIEVGKLDGFTGPTSKAAFETLNYRLATGKDLPDWRDLVDKDTSTIITPKSSLIWPLESNLEKFYGKVGENQVFLALPYPMKLAWDTKTTVTRMQCHEKVHDALERIFKKTLAAYGEAKIRQLRLDLFAGCLNVRKMQGSATRMSTHSWGIAVDLDSANNQLKWNHAKASLAKPEYDEFWKIVESEGAVSLGRALDYDWMHLQFARRA